MNKMNRFASYLVSMLFCIGLFTALAASAEAAVLKFEPTSFTGAVGDTFDVQVKVDPEGEQISGTDVYVIFDSSIVTAENVEKTDLFDTINSTIDTDQVYLNGIFTDGTSYIDAEGVMATITFKLNAATPGTLQFYCDTTQNDTSKIVKNDVNATNVIECDNLTLFSMNGGTNQPASGTNPTTAPAANPTALPQTGQGQQTTTTGGSQVVYVAAPQTLPQSGVFDNVINFAVPGGIMLLIGVAIKFLL